MWKNLIENLFEFSSKEKILFFEYGYLVFINGLILSDIYVKKKILLLISFRVSYI